MRLTRYLKPAQIRMELGTTTPDTIPEGWSPERFRWHVKEEVLKELVDLFDTSGKVPNRSKLTTDLLNRERKATTGIGDGIAIPHVRTLQARDFIMVFARSTPGVEFMALDGRPVHLFIGVVAPPYDDRLYLQIYKRVAQVFSQPQARQHLLQASDAHEVIKVLSDVSGWERLGLEG
jgi:mannitol/fructose-specific phosphotransferase system IIA component (Ntr-type)